MGDVVAFSEVAITADLLDTPSEKAQAPYPNVLVGHANSTRGSRPIPEALGP